METVRENIKPDKVRYLVTEVSSKQTTKTELIQIGASNFCRINDGEWINSKGACRGGWITSVPDAVSSQYFVETVNDKGNTARIYRAYNLYKISDSGGKESMTYEETKFWISEVGNFLRRETIYALKDTKQIRSKEIRTYEYDPKDLKIEAPIKQ